MAFGQRKVERSGFLRVGNATVGSPGRAPLSGNDRHRPETGLFQEFRKDLRRRRATACTRSGAAAARRIEETERRAR